MFSIYGIAYRELIKLSTRPNKMVVVTLNTSLLSFKVRTEKQTVGLGVT